uniref:Tyrosine-protein kinase RYK-like n=2 Tax=Hirondellea gigas TaxID=1518452 RepID=A0A6A7FV84_9CRUS
MTAYRLRLAHYVWLPLLLLLTLTPDDLLANLNLYLTKEEVQGLLGLNSELYYVRAGVLNTYALGYTVMVPSNTTSLHFTWNSIAKRPMAYEVAVEYDDPAALLLPKLNISHSGIVPTHPTTFRLTLPCSGKSNAEVLVTLHLNVSTRANNRTSVTLRRKKICLKAIAEETASEMNQSVSLSPEFAHSSIGTVYIAMGCAATATVLIITLAAVLYLRVKRARDTSTVTSRYYSSPGYFGSGRAPASLRSNSYATIASCKHLTNPNPILVDNRNVHGYNFNFACVGKSADNSGSPAREKEFYENKIQSKSDEKKNKNLTSVSTCGATLQDCNSQIFGLSGRSCVSENINSKPNKMNDSSCGIAAQLNTNNTNKIINNCPDTSIAGIRNNANRNDGCGAPLITGPDPIVGQNSVMVSNSLHYASSSLSQASYSQPYYSPAHSWHPNSRLSLASSWGATLRSQLSWREKRRKDNKEVITSLEVDRWRVVVGDMTHGGTFGRVHEGICRDPKTGLSHPVIIKTVSGAASKSQAQLVLHEGLLLAGLHHENLLPVMGVCTDSPHPPLLLYHQHIQPHNLKQFLLKSSSGSGGISKLLTHDAVGLAIGVCEGLLHLHQRGILHKDVATRNCSIDSSLCVRVCDTALARDLFPGDYHCLGDNENRPVKWLPIEALQHNTYSRAADVWMFGVLLWELITLAQPPYVEVDPYEMSVYLRDGYRLAQPRSCPDDLFGVMAVCWAPKPDDRPPLHELLACLQAFHTTLTAFI